MIEFILEIELHSKYDNLNKVFLKKPSITHHYNNDHIELIVWGDPIIGEEFEKKIKNTINEEFIVNNIYGHYYFLLLNKKHTEFTIGNSLFSILPLYYIETKDRLIISHNALTIGEHLSLNTISKRFVLETILFNYPLFNQSIIEKILLVPSNSYIKVNADKWRIIKHTRIEKYFSFNPTSWRRSIDAISELFLESVQKYLPSTPFVSSLTGGFDSRTLTSVCLFNKKDFSCYSFGSLDSRDTEIPEVLTEKAGLQYLKIILDNHFIENNSLKHGYEFIFNASGIPSFVRAHYLYSAKILEKNTEYMITGNFGSELFRAAHVRGVVFSPNLITLFSNSNFNEAFNAVKNSKDSAYLNRDGFGNVWFELKEDLSALPCYNPDYKLLTQNQKFYVFVFEEVFRKYFGAEMVNQFKYIKNRTPYLDIDFMKAIFTTGLAGIHSDFFEHDPFKRFKGQVLYAHIIRKTYPLFGKIVTDKGYNPNDLLTFSGYFKILKGYLNKKVIKPKHIIDPFAVKKAYQLNRESYKQIPVDMELFHSELINEDAYNKPEVQLFKVISLSYIKNLIECKKE
jgi:asparagine synthase (glutamine-hydrolysing)